METVIHKYSIKDLEQKTGILVRTIRFYIKEGLVPPPNGTGGGASYDDSHLVPLQAIKILHESSIKLTGIREVLKGMSADEMTAFVTDASTQKRKWDMEALKKWVAPATPPAAVTGNFSFAAIGTGQPQPRPATSLLGRLNRTASIPAPQETWVRISPLDGVELHIRSDIDDKTKTMVMQFAEQLQNQQ